MRGLARAGLVSMLLVGASLVGFDSTGAASASVNVPCSGTGGGAAGLVTAVHTVNTAGGGSINLAAGCTYQLAGVENSNQNGSNGLPMITTQITINGKGVTIAGQGEAGDFRIIEVSPTGNLTLNGLTITGGYNDIGGGGGISNHGTLTLNSSEVSGNAAIGGGGIASGPGNPFTGGGLLTLNKSKVDDNTAFGGFQGGGGGVSNGGTLVSNNTEVTENSAPDGPAGGILNHGVSATLNKTSVTGNSAGFGAGIVNADFGLPSTPSVSLTLNNSQVTGNDASVLAGGILNGLDDVVAPGTVTLNHTQVANNTPDQCEPTGTIAGCTG